MRCTNGGLLRLLMTLQDFWDNQWECRKSRRLHSTTDSALQTAQNECDRMYESVFLCDAGVYLDKWLSGLGRLKLSFLQLANDLHYSALVDEININLFQFLTRFNHFNQRLVNFQIYIMRTLLKTLKPRVFHGRDDWDYLVGAISGCRRCLGAL